MPWLAPATRPLCFRSLMADVTEKRPADEPPPFWQRVYDNVWLMLALGLIVMFVVYTAWGIWEVVTLPPATLP